MASEWCTPTGSSTICPTKLSPSRAWSSPCHRATGAQKRGFHQLPTLLHCPSGVQTPSLPSGSRGPSLEVRCGASSSHAYPMALPGKQNTKVGDDSPPTTSRPSDAHHLTTSSPCPGCTETHRNTPTQQNTADDKQAVLCLTHTGNHAQTPKQSCLQTITQVGAHPIQPPSNTLTHKHSSSGASFSSHPERHRGSEARAEGLLPHGHLLALLMWLLTTKCQSPSWSPQPHPPGIPFLRWSCGSLLQSPQRSAG